MIYCLIEKTGYTSFNYLDAENDKFSIGKDELDGIWDDIQGETK
jgi:hypothetical protein